MSYGSGMMSGMARRERIFLPFVFMSLLAVGLLAGCGGNSTGQQGEIVGINAEASFQEAQSGEIENLAYADSIVVKLNEGETVTASCPEEFLSDIADAPDFNVDQITSGGFIANITIKLEEQQQVLLAQNEEGEWYVKEVLK